MEVNKVIFYLDNSPIHTRTVAPFDADYQYTGLAPNTAHELKAEIYSDNTLIDTKLVNITTDTSISWANLVVADYVNRVEADYGAVEDAVVLEADLNTGTEQEYLDAIAIYNPNGGHRTGKIYNVRKNETELTDLGYLANEYIYPDNGGRYTISYDSTTFPNPRIGSAKFTANNTGFSVALVHKAVQVDGDYNFSIYAKAGISNYLIVRETGTTNPFEVWFDILNGTITKDTLGIGSIATEANGWFRLSVANTTNAGESIAPRLYITNSGTGYSAGVGDTVYIAGVQLTKGLSLKPFYNFLPYDLTVTGGGGTRTNLQGLVENITAHTNFETHSYDLITNAAFTVNASATMTLNQVGITGIANQAILLSDDDSSDLGFLKRSLYTLTSGIHKVSVWIKKDNDESRFPEINITFRRASDSVGQQSLIDLNTKTGVIAYRLGRNNNNTQVNDRGDWWEVVTASIEPTDRLATLDIYPAIQTVLGGSASAVVTGSIIIGHIGLYDIGKLVTAPIITNGSTLSATSPKIDYSTGQAAFLVEPTRTNYVQNSFDMTNIWWSKTRAFAVSLNEVGILGQENGATTISTTSTTDYAEIIKSSQAVPSGKYQIVVWVRKENNDTTFPEFLLNFNGSSGLERNIIQLNRTTGAFHHGRAGYGDSTVTVLSKGNWWELKVVSLSSSVTTIQDIGIRPALSDNLGTINLSLLGDVVIGYVEAALSPNETPIITNGAVVTRTEKFMKNESLPIPMKGNIFVDMTLPNDTSFYDKIIYNYAINDNNRLLVNFRNDGKWFIYFNNNGTLLFEILPIVATSGRHKLLLNWDDSSGMEIYLDGVNVHNEAGTGFVSPTIDKLSVGNAAYQTGYAINSSIHNFILRADNLTSQEAIDLTTI